MCMMKNSGEKEACEVANNLAALDGRVTKVEERMNKMEGSLNDGFKSLSVSISNLGHDVGNRVNLIEKKVVDEKQEWGRSFRKWLDWIVKQIALAPFALLCLFFCAVSALFYGIIFLTDSSERRTQIAA